MLLHHSDERLESGAQTEIKPPPLLPPDAVSLFVCKRSATILTEEVPALGNRSHFFPMQLFFRVLAPRFERNISPKSYSLICLPVNNNANSTPLLKEAGLICQHGFT